MPNTRKQVVVLVDKPEYVAVGVNEGDIISCQISGGRATPYKAGQRTIHLLSSEWKEASCEDLMGATGNGNPGGGGNGGGGNGGGGNGGGGNGGGGNGNN